MSEQTTTTTAQPASADARAVGELIVNGLERQAEKAGVELGYWAHVVKRTVLENAERVNKDESLSSITSMAHWFATDDFEHFKSAEDKYRRAIDDIDWSVLGALELAGFNCLDVRKQLIEARQRGYDKGFSGQRS